MIDRLTAEDVRQLASALLKAGAKIVLIKCGQKGMYLRTAEELPDMGRAWPQQGERWKRRELWDAPCCVEEIHSTTGAGDTAIAGFLAAFLQEYDPQTALRVASYAAARCIEGYDTSGALERLEDAILHMNRYKKMQMEWGRDDWIPCSNHGQWIGRYDTNWLRQVRQTAGTTPEQGIRCTGTCCLPNQNHKK